MDWALAFLIGWRDHSANQARQRACLLTLIYEILGDKEATSYIKLLDILCYSFDTMKRRRKCVQSCHFQNFISKKLRILFQVTSIWLETGCIFCRTRCGLCCSIHEQIVDYISKFRSRLIKSTNFNVFDADFMDWMFNTSRQLSWYFGFSKTLNITFWLANMYSSQSPWWNVTIWSFQSQHLN